MTTFMPPPAPLTRHYSVGMMNTSDDETDEEKKTRYLQYECTYRACKYKDPLKTWGELVKTDYSHFCELMTNHVPLESTTFDVLKGELFPPDLKVAENTVRHQDTEKGQEEQLERYLDMKCEHRGRMHGKTWREILKKDYNYFMWSVGNTMGRDTRTFKTFIACLKTKDQTIVLSTEKGKVKTKKSPKFK